MQQVIDHYEKPRNVGSFKKSDNNVGTGLVGAPACGDVMKLQVRVSAAGVSLHWRTLNVLYKIQHTSCNTQVDEQGNITESCFKTFGCGSAIASSSVATEW